LKILVIGAGAVGGYFGARLAHAGRDVTFLVRPHNAERLRREGLRIVSPHGDFHLRPKLRVAGEIDSAFDIVLLSVKAYSLSGAIDDFAPAVGESTIIVPALNGMRHMDLLASRFGPRPIAGGVCLIISEVDDAGRIVQLTNIHSLIYGEPQGGISERMERLHSTLDGAGFTARLSENITPEMWQKWVQLSSLGALTCLMRGSIGDIEAAPGGKEIALAIFDECVAVATACGYPPTAEFVAAKRADMTAVNSKLTASMYRDLKKGARVEADQIVGDFIQRGRQAGVKTPLVDAAYVNLKIYERAQADNQTAPS
jgi:2-dehydropantoate 2-reductase